MDRLPHFLMTDPAHFDVSYQINPWMQPSVWRADRAQFAARATAASDRLKAALVEAGAEVTLIKGVRGLPDLVFPANAAIVLDGRALLARFRHPERQGEEAIFRDAFLELKARGLLQDVVELPQGLFQEGAGDCIWDADRRLFWAGHGPRSSQDALAVIERLFGQEVVPLELASERFYHLDTCFCPLAGGKLLYYPAAFTPASLAAIQARVPTNHRIEASDEEATSFCVNAVNIDAKVILARAPDSLRRKLRARGYTPVEVDLDPFILSGGAAYCMTLRLDRTSVPAPAFLAAE